MWSYIGIAMIVIGAIFAFIWGKRFDADNKNRTSGASAGIAIIILILGTGVLSFSANQIGIKSAEAELKLSYDVNNCIELKAGDRFSEIIIGSDGKFTDQLENVLTTYITNAPLVKRYEGTIWQPKNLNFKSSLKSGEIYTGWYTAKWSIYEVKQADKKIASGIVRLECTVDLKHPPFITPDKIGPLGKTADPEN